jgi:lipoprotein-anchoring transpeptidase ErfK/SrfK
MNPLELRVRLRALRRLHSSQLKDLAGLAAELERVDSPRYQELAGKRLKAAAATGEQLAALERELGPTHIGGTCPNCGLHSSRTRYCLRCGENLQPSRRPDPISVPGALVAVAAITVAWLLGGVNLGTQTASTHPGTATSQGPGVTAGVGRRPVAAGPRYASVVARAKGSSIAIFHSPTDSAPYTTLSNPNIDGAPLVFLVKSRTAKWANVMLPMRPNGSTGWIRLSRVKLAGLSYHLLIDLRRHRLTAWNANKLVLRTPVGVGRAVTPTPSGNYYITELLKQPDPTGIYGPYAFGLSAYSNVLHEFAGRDGILGIHGTNFPQGIGTNVSHGCIRLSNRAIIKLARTLPIGTPVRITRA